MKTTATQNISVLGSCLSLNMRMYSATRSVASRGSQTGSTANM